MLSICLLYAQMINFGMFQIAKINNITMNRCTPLSSNRYIQYIVNAICILFNGGYDIHLYTIKTIKKIINILSSITDLYHYNIVRSENVK